MTTPPEFPASSLQVGPLSDDDFREFQTILREESGEELTLAEARIRALEVVSLFQYFAESLHDQQPPEALAQPNADVFVPSAVPVPELVPLEPANPGFDGLRESLQQLAVDLPITRRRTTQWRSAIIHLWGALAEVLTKNKPDSIVVGSGPGELSRLFRAVALERPELPQVESSVEVLDDLRTRWLRVGVTRWPVSLGKLPGIFLDGLRVIQRLEPGVEVPTAAVEKLMAGRPFP